MHWYECHDDDGVVYGGDNGVCSLDSGSSDGYESDVLMNDRVGGAYRHGLESSVW